MNAHSTTPTLKSLAVLDGRGALPDLAPWLSAEGFDVRVYTSAAQIFREVAGGERFFAILLDPGTAPDVEMVRQMKTLLGAPLLALEGDSSRGGVESHHLIGQDLIDSRLHTPITEAALKAALRALRTSPEGEDALKAEDEGRSAEQEVPSGHSLAEVVLHDIRNPLMAVHRIAEQMSHSELLSPVGRRDLETMLEAIRGGLKRIEWTRRTHHLERDVPTVAARQPCKVRELVREATTALGFSPAMVTWAPGNAAPELMVDGAMFRRVLEHLLVNAQNYGEGTAELKIRVDGARLVVEVADRGPGLSEDLTAGAYDLAEDQVGLQYVEGAVRAHEGSLELCPRDGGGLLVRTIWPELLDSGLFGEAAEVPRLDATRLKVWLVDDEPMVLKATARLLRIWKHDTELFESGEAMLQALPLADPAPDLILCDAHMPGGMKGLEVLSRARTLSPRTSRMLYTGVGADAEVVDAFNQGVVNRYIQKGSESSELKRAIEVVIQERRQSAPGVLSPDDETLRARFEEMLAKQMLTLHLQPIFDGRTRQIVACEALMRSKHPDFRGPLDILDAAKAFDRDMALQKVLTRLARDIRARLPEHMLLFVNVDPGLVTSVHHVDAGLGDLYPMAGQVILEMTERARLGTDAAQAAAVARLREVGFRLALDDVGAGYNSLAAVVAVEPEVLKLDISLVSGLDKDPRKAEMVRLLVEYAGGHGIDTVAEGIECPAEAITCARLGVRWLQGYHFCKPMALEDLAEKFSFTLR